MPNIRTTTGFRFSDELEAVLQPVLLVHHIAGGLSAYRAVGFFGYALNVQSSAIRKLRQARRDARSRRLVVSR